MGTSTNSQGFDQSARFVLQNPEFQATVRQRISDSPNTDEYEILFLLIEKTRENMGYDLRTEEGRKATQKLVKKDLLKDIRRIFNFLPNVRGQIQKLIPTIAHHIIPEEGNSTSPQQDVSSDHPIFQLEENKTVSIIEHLSTSVEKIPGTTGKILSFVFSMVQLKNLASRKDEKVLWTKRLKKENISLERESKEWKELFETLSRNPIPEGFFSENPNLKPLEQDYHLIQKLSSAVKARYKKDIEPLVLQKIGRENINPYKIPDFYKLSLEQVIDFIRGTRTLDKYLSGVFEVYEYTPKAFNSRKVSDILKKQ